MIADNDSCFASLAFFAAIRTGMRLIDLSHVIEHGLVTYPGLPAPAICDFWSRKESAARYEQGTSFHIGRIDMVANTGTYIDAPFHRFAEGRDVAALELARVAGLPGVLVEAPAGDRAMGAESFQGTDVRGRAVLVRTGWDRHWNTPAYFDGHPFLTGAAAEWLRDAGAALVGIDSLNIDDTSGGARPVHTTLLGADVPIVEHLCNLGRIAGRAFRFHAVPAPVRGMGSFPVRAFAEVGDA